MPGVNSKSFPLPSSALIVAAYLDRFRPARLVDARGGPAIGPTVNFSSPVAPHDVVGEAHGCIRHGKTFAPQQLQFTRDAAAIATDPATRGDHAVTGNIDRHRIVVHGITDGPRSLRRSGCSA